MNEPSDNVPAPEAAGLAERVQRIEDLLNKNRWAGRVIMRGTLPVGVVRDTLPTAAVEFAYAYITIRDVPAGGVAAEVTYQCLRNAAGAWGWRTVATG